MRSFYFIAFDDFASLFGDYLSDEVALILPGRFECQSARQQRVVGCFKFRQRPAFPPALLSFMIRRRCPAVLLGSTLWLPLPLAHDG